MVYHKEDQADVAIAAKAAAELKEFTGLAQSMLSVDWSAAPPAIRAAFVDLRGTNDAVQRALDVLVAQATHFAPASNRTAASLPGDVLHEIFRTWLSLDGDHRSSRIPSAFTAAAVNKHWRSVALQSGSLWATLIIDFDHTNDLNEHIDNVLERSQGYPLDLTILKAPLTGWYLEPSADHIARLLSASRTIRCSFSSSDESSYDFDQSVLAIFQTELPLAETIICSNYHPGCLLPMGVQLFTLSPKLRRLEMDSIPLDAVDWSLVPHLTAFATQCLVTEEQLRIICTSCPRLTDLSFFDINTPLSGVAAHSLPYLERLRCDGRQALQYFGHHTSVPVLHTLEIPCSAQTLLHLSIFIRDTPWTSLRVLELHYIWNSDSPPEFLHAMRNMPNLVEFTRRTASPSFSRGGRPRSCAETTLARTPAVFLPNLGYQGAGRVPSGSYARER
ncbi:hypothetical protein EXIGLDRAFT_837230 [Exidia glandulosa HHB12029]|uniref:F-box domain-containing protein n=1 Tax=Exidia glandulosa HHB12029 TaxID=1314781 RepID=A0A166AEZ1_EXIGL|nr:hypothetical protein EXIGLDRAFT_837230 [Exidia glandulosa HHB12029]